MDMGSILPSTSYIKIIDGWMLASLVFIFSKVFLFVLLNKAKKKDDLLQECIAFVINMTLTIDSDWYSGFFRYRMVSTPQIR